MFRLDEEKASALCSRALAPGDVRLIRARNRFGLAASTLTAVVWP